MSFVYSILFFTAVAAFAFWGSIHVTLATRLTVAIMDQMETGMSRKEKRFAIKTLKHTVLKGLAGSLFTLMAAIEFHFAANNPGVAFGSYFLRAEVAGVVGGLLAIITILAVLKLTATGFYRYCKMEGILGGKHYRKGTKVHSQRRGY